LISLGTVSLTKFHICSFQHANDETKQFSKSATDYSTYASYAAAAKQFLKSPIDGRIHRTIFQAQDESAEVNGTYAQRTSFQPHDLPSAIFMRNGKKNALLEVICRAFCFYYVQYRPSGVTVNFVLTKTNAVHLLAVHALTYTHTDAWLHGKSVTY